MKSNPKSSKRIYNLELLDYQSNFLINIVGLGIGVVVMILGNLYGWVYEATIPVIIVVSVSLFIAYRPRKTDVRIELDDSVLSIFDASAKESEASMIFDLEQVQSFSVKRSGRYSELVRLKVGLEQSTTTIVLRSSPSPKDDDDLRRMERSLAPFVR